MYHVSRDNRERNCVALTFIASALSIEIFVKDIVTQIIRVFAFTRSCASDIFSQSRDAPLRGRDRGPHARVTCRGIANFHVTHTDE